MAETGRKYVKDLVWKKAFKWYFRFYVVCLTFISILNNLCGLGRL